MLDSPELTLHCINLARATERRRKIQEAWGDRLGCEVAFFDAVDVRDFPKRVVIQPDQELAKKRIGRTLTNGEIACATSHYLLLKKLYDSGCPEAIVMEDDVLPYPGRFRDKHEMFAKIRTASRAFPNIKALIMHDPDNRTDEEKRISGRIGLFGYSQASGECYVLNDPPWGSRFVWYSREGMALLMRYLEKPCAPTDTLYRISFLPERSLALLFPPLATHDGTTSYIENERWEKDNLYRKAHGLPLHKREFIP